VRLLIATGVLMACVPPLTAIVAGTELLPSVSTFAPLTVVFTLPLNTIEPTVVPEVRRLTTEIAPELPKIAPAVTALGTTPPSHLAPTPQSRLGPPIQFVPPPGVKMATASGFLVPPLVAIDPE